MRDNDAQLIWEAYLKEAVVDTEMQLANDGGYTFIATIDGETFTVITGEIVDDPNVEGQRAVEIFHTEDSPTHLRGKGYGNIAYSELAQWARDNGMTNVYSGGSVSPDAGGVYKSLGRRGAFQHTQNPAAQKKEYGVGQQDYKMTMGKNPGAVHRLNIANQPLSGRYKQGLDYDSEGNPVIKRTTKTTHV